MKRIIMFVLLFAALKVAGQTTGYLRFDTVKIMRQNGTCELYIINKTKDSLGLLTNVGGGLTQFKRARAINDSMIIIGNDTIQVRGTGGGTTLMNAPGTADTLFVSPDKIKRLDHDATLVFSTNSNKILMGADTISWIASIPRLTDTARALRDLIGAGGGVSDGDKGDITVSSSGATWTIDNTAVTYSKIQNVTTNKLLGRYAGTSGVTQEVQMGRNMGLDGTGKINAVVLDSTYQIGNLYDSSAWGNYNSFTTTGSPTIVSNKIRLPVDGGSGVKVNWLYASMLEQETLQVDFKYKTLLSTDTAFTVGWESINTSTAVSLFGRVRTSTGAIRIFATVNGTPSEAVIASSSVLSGGIAVNDSLSYIFYRNKDTTKFTVINHTTGQTGFAITIRNFQSSGETGGLHNAGVFTLVNTTATTNTVEVCRIKFSSHALKSHKMGLVGNSISSGSFSHSAAARFGEIAGMQIFAGGNDISYSGLQQVHVLNTYVKPQNLFVMLGGNDIAFGISSSTWQSNLTAFHDSLVAAGTRVIWLLATPRNGTDITPLNNWIISNNWEYIDTYTPLWSGSGTGLNSSYDDGDGTHPNVTGHSLLAATIMANPIYRSITQEYYNVTGAEGLNSTLAAGNSSSFKMNITGAGTTDSKFTVGSLQVQPLSVPNNVAIIDNMTWNGSAWIRKNTGYGSGFQFYDGGLIFRSFGTGSAGSSASGATYNPFVIGNDRSVGIGGTTGSTSAPFTGSVMSVLNSNEVLINKSSSNSAGALQVQGQQWNEAALDGNHYLIVKNTTSGSNAQTNIRVQNDNDDFATTGIYSSSTSPNGVLAAGGSYTLATPSAGHSIVATAGPIKFAAAGTTEGMRLNTSNQLLIGRTSAIGSEKISINGTINANADSTTTATGGFVYRDAATGAWKITGAPGSNGPQVYTALLTQSGTGNPTATVLGTNGIGSIVWTRNSTGNYTGTLTGAFTANKTWLICAKGDGIGNFVNGLLSRTSADALLLDVRDNNATVTDNFTNMSIEIRVYP